MKKLLLIVIICAIPAALFPAKKSDKKGEVIIMNDVFINAILNESNISRDDYIAVSYNKIISARGYVESVQEIGEYKRKYRIVIADTASSGKIDIKYFVYTDNKEYLQILHKSDIFEFKGQFVMATPLNSKRDSYIFDIILEDGALVVE